MKRLHIADRANIIPATLARENTMVCVETINKDTGEVTDSMGNIGYVVTWLDAKQKRCEPEAAVFAIAHCGCHWISVDLRQYYAATIH